MILSHFSRRGWGLVFLFLAPSFLALRADTGSLDDANQAYSDGHYEQAATQFQQLITDEGYSAALCFNLGNAELKAGHLGLALLNYERARYLAPRDADIDHNLQLARQQAGLKPNSYRWWQTMLRGIDWTLLFSLIMAGLGFILLGIIGSNCSSAPAASFQVEPGTIRRTCKTVLFVAIPATMLLIFVELSAVGFNARVEGVVTAKDATLRLSPFESAEQLGTMPEGELVTVEQHHGDYYRVEARDGQFGWLKDKQLEPIVAGSFDPEK